MSTSRHTVARWCVVLTVLSSFLMAGGEGGDPGGTDCATFAKKVSVVCQILGLNEAACMSFMGQAKAICGETSCEGLSAAIQALVDDFCPARKGGDGGGDGSACDRAKAAAASVCAAWCGDPTDPPDCITKCLQDHAAAIEQCVADGGTPEDCKRAALNDCRAACGLPPEPTCEQRCAASAEEYARTVCWACASGCATTKGGDPAENPPCEGPCKDLADAMALRFAAACAAQCESEAGEKSCALRCLYGVPSFIKNYFATNGDCDNLPAAVEEFLAACPENCDDSTDPPDTPKCEERCFEVGRQTFDECAKDPANDAATCELLSKEAVRLCMADCEGNPPTCGDTCAERARQKLEECKASCGGNEEDCARCRLEANEILAQCLKDECNLEPPEPETCEERCAAAKERYRDQCKLDCAGSDDPNCVAACQEQFLQDCVARCQNPGDPGDCSAQLCERLTAGLLETCRQLQCPDAAPGEDCALCATLAELFAAMCQDEFAWACRMGERKDMPPRAFRRGDADGNDQLNIADAIGVLEGLFRNKPERLQCADAADANDDGDLNIADPICILGHLFDNRGSLPEPFTGRGHDPTADTIMCE